MHPLIKILLFIFIVLLMSFLRELYLWPMCLVLCFYATFLVSGNFIRVVKRMKWLFFSIFIIYAFSTPGEYVSSMPSSIAPTIEGCVLSSLQVAKLLIALATLNILFATSTKEQLMSGLHLLLSPLSLFRLNITKFTARLLLTLDYVEALAADEKFKFRFDELDQMLEFTEPSHCDKVIQLELPNFQWFDKAIVLLLIVCNITLIYLRIIDFKVSF